MEKNAILTCDYCDLWKVCLTARTLTVKEKVFSQFSSSLFCAVSHFNICYIDLISSFDWLYCTDYHTPSCKVSKGDGERMTILSKQSFYTHI